jgi:hypothetical protein
MEAIADTPKQPAQQPVRKRSRISSGRDLLPTVDGRSAWALLFRNTCELLADHVGGLERLSEPERMTIRRAAALECELVHLEDDFAKERLAGRAPYTPDLDLYQRITNTQRRVLDALGMQRRPREVGDPDLHDYLRAKAANAESSR